MVAQRPDRKLDQHILAPGIIFMRHDGMGGAVRIQRPHIQAEAHEVAFSGSDQGALALALEQHVAGVEILQAHAPFAFGAIGQQHAGALIEVEANAGRANLRRHSGAWWIG